MIKSIFKIKTCFLLFCIVCTFFFSITIVLITLASDHHNFQQSYKRPLVDKDTDIQSELALSWTEEEEERTASAYIQAYSLHLTNRHMPGALNETWMEAARWVTSSQTFPPHSSAMMGHILKWMHDTPIRRAGVARKGTQLKLKLTLGASQQAIFKPKWYSRDTVLEGTPYEGRDRHNGEVAAFHLSRILNFRRTPLVVGRVIDLYKEILPVASKQLRSTFFTEKKELCFLGKCLYCKTRKDAACAERGKMEGVMVLWLPTSLTYKMYKHPWRRSYGAKRKIGWEEEMEKFDEFGNVIENNSSNNNSNSNNNNNSNNNSNNNNNNNSNKDIVNNSNNDIVNNSNNDIGSNSNNDIDSNSASSSHTAAPSYCSKVSQEPLLRHSSLMLDVIDTCIFDFLIANADRHHFEVFGEDSVYYKGVGRDGGGGGGGGGGSDGGGGDGGSTDRDIDSKLIDTKLNDVKLNDVKLNGSSLVDNKTTSSHPFLVMFDNGKSFGNPFKDEISILAPLLQCNIIRKTTAKRLNSLKQGLIMRVLKAILSADPLPKPIITNHHLLAISRRLDKVIDILKSRHIYFI